MPLAPTSLASALGSEAAAPISSTPVPVVPPTPPPAAPPERSAPEPGTGEREPDRVPLGRTSPPVTQPGKGKGMAKHAIKSAQEMLGLRESPKKELDRMAKELREQTTKGDIVLPVAPKPKPAAKVPDEEPSPVARPTPETPPAAPVEAKIKLGDKEYTPAELKARMDELEEKAKTPAAPAAKKEDPAAPAKKPEEIAAERKANEMKFIEDEAKAFKPEDYGIALDEATMDTILAGGKESVEAFKTMLAKIAIAADLRSRKWAEEQLNPVLDQFEQRLSPLAAKHKEIESYKAEQRFFEKHPDLQPLQDRVRIVRQTIIDNYSRSKAAVEKGVGTAQDQHYVQTFEKMDDAALDTETAEHVRELAKAFGGIPPVAAAAPVVPAPVIPAAPAPPKPRPTPPTAQLSGTVPPRANTGASGLIGQLSKMEGI
jgi:hypothetical protein